MAHFAEINENNKVVRVLVTDNNDPNGDEGYQFLVDNFGGTWIKTSYNTINNKHLKGGQPFRGNFAGVGYVYDENLDIFLPPKPFESWEIDEENANWKAPIPKPDVAHVWNEELGSWELGEPPYPSWNYSREMGRFEPPVPRPAGKYYWNEELGKWAEIIEVDND